MKKKKNRILSVSGAALCLFFPILLAACSQEDALPRPLEVSAEVGSPATRAAADSHADDYDKSEFVAGDVIRITDGTKTADYGFVSYGVYPDSNRSAHSHQFLEKQPADGYRSTRWQ